MKSSVLIMAGLAAGCLPAILLLAAGPQCAFSAQPDLPAAAVVKVVRASKECFSDSIKVTGIFVPRQEAIIVLDGTATITEVLIAEGDQVKLGQPLARASRLGASPG
ncbi:MAG: efflux RND transporter periplasmic adaptor subunit, partial [Methylocapsa sp.]|nr:efflux RND transporter periplasmic adaptor subunit [Methylocapsa sp.]